jgi:hypothetical protein
VGIDAGENQGRRLSFRCWVEYIIPIDAFYLTVKPTGFGECGVHTQNKKNGKVELCFVFFSHFFLGRHHAV